MSEENFSDANNWSYQPELIFSSFQAEEDILAKDQ